MINLKTNTVDLQFFKRVLREIKNNKERALDLFDSFSESQFESKNKLFGLLDQVDIKYEESNAAIFGCWYGSILISELLSRNIKSVTSIDVDDQAIAIARNVFFPNQPQLDFITADVSTTKLSRYADCNLFINTSCEHMPPAKDWLFWRSVQEGAIFTFQSNNMEGIEGHINCVHSIQEFKQQLPPHFEVLFKGENIDDRGTRYTLVGRIGKIKLANKAK
jgi:SAM-dependent methyltransferase